MSQTVRVGLIGAGAPGMAHGRGYVAAGGFKIVAVADLIPQRREQSIREFGELRQYAQAEELVADRDLDAVSICLPNDLHAPIAIAALKAGKHVLCEAPPATDVKQVRQMEAASRKSGKKIAFALSRRFGPAEQAAAQAVAKGYAGEIYHVRAGWTRTRGIPTGTGWYADRSRSGGGAMLDLGLPLLDLAWLLLSRPQPVAAFAVTQRRLMPQSNPNSSSDVEEFGSAILRFAGGKSIELAASWAINQPPQQNGTICRACGQNGSIDVYTAQGSILYRGFDHSGQAKATALKPPRIIHHAAIARNFREAILGKAEPACGPDQAVALMQMMAALYRSAEEGKSVAVK